MRVITMCACLSAIVLSLGGCVESDKPLIPASKASMLLADGTYRGGKAGALDTDIDPEKMRDTVTVKRRVDDYLVTKKSPPDEDDKVKKEKTELYLVRFQQLDEEHYVAQIREVQKTATPYKYLFVHAVPDGAVKFYGARCDLFKKSERIVRAYDMILPKTSLSSCEAKSYEGLIAFMQEVPLQFKEFSSFEYAIEKPK